MTTPDSEDSLRDRRVKIVATLGPASDSQAMIEQLFLAGVNVFRVNFSHGTQAEKATIIRRIRAVEEQYAMPIGVLADLQGPKIRIGTVPNGAIALPTGSVLELALADPDLALPSQQADALRVLLPHPEVFAAVIPGDQIKIDDGRIVVEVIAHSEALLRCTVLVGGELKDRKGVNIPGRYLPIPALTEKDHSDLHYALEQEVDWIALSFVQRPEDILLMRKLVGDKARIMAKIEKPTALDQLDEIVRLSDAVMVARGDLGVELPVELVPRTQKTIVAVARRLGRPVLVATQMLESMTSAPTPTRAEASDVAAAVYDGADAVMLSAETATGDYPVTVVEVMSRILRSTETDPGYLPTCRTAIPLQVNNNADAIAHAIRALADSGLFASVVTFTATGTTTYRIARERPNLPLLGLTPFSRTARQLTLVWGVYAVKTRDIATTEEMVGKATRIARRDQFAANGEQIIVTAGIPFGVPGSTNNIRCAVVGEHEKEE